MIIDREKLELYRYEKAMTVEQLAKKIKIHRTYLSSILNKRRLPSKAVSHRINLLLESIDTGVKKTKSNAADKNCVQS